MVVFVLACPETSADNILRRRAVRLRKLTGRTNIKSKSEIAQAEMKPSEIFLEAIIKPIEIMFKDPAIAFTNVYVSWVSFVKKTWDSPLTNNVTDLFNLRHLLLILRGLPSCLPTHLWIQRRRGRSLLLNYWSCMPDRRHILPHLPIMVSYSRHQEERPS